MYDLIIIGCGPAGITAGIYAARKGINFLIITKDIGGQATLSSDIQNYTGFQFVSGIELAEKFKEHLKNFNIQLNEWEQVTQVQRKNNSIIVTSDKREYQAKSVVIASGRVPRMLGVKGEEEFKNRGVTYCATCDGPLFKDKDTAVMGGGNSAFDAAIQLMNIAKKVYIIDRADKLIADSIMIEKASKKGNVEILSSTALKEIYGKELVEGIKIVKDNKQQDIPVQGVFVEVGADPVSQIAKDVKKNKINEICINCKCETNIPGIFAAGDVTDVYSKQIIIACGEGAKAVLACFEYLVQL
ncbi:NAD(P)/FAD-dependent oxidoreductase [bacterium]